jgi:hypothetical protein
MNADRTSDNAAAPAPHGPDRSLRSRISYSFDNALSRGPVVVIAWLGLLTLGVILVGGLIITLFGVRGINSSGKPLGFFESFWQTLLRVMDAGTFAGDSGWPERVLSLLITLCGIFLAGSLIGLIASAVDQRIELLRKGRSAVLEEGHTLIIGWSERVPAILSELVVANESERRAAVVVLSDVSKAEMEDTLREHVDDLRTTHLVCRTGDSAHPKDLTRVNAAGAASIIVVSGEDGDAGVVKAVLACNSLTPGFPGRHVVIELKDPDLGHTLREIIGDRVVSVTSDGLIAELTAQACRQKGLSQVFRDLLDFDGDEIYFGKFPELSGRTFADARLSFESCSVIGLMGTEGRVLLNPEPARPISAEDEIIALARDDSEFVLSSVRSASSTPLRGTPGGGEVQQLLILGWSRLAPIVLRELHEFLPESTRVDVAVDPELVDPVEVAAVLRTWERNTNVVEVPGGPERLLTQDLGRFEKAIVLAYRDALPTADADAKTLLTILALRRLHPANLDDPVQIVAEMLDTRSVPIASAAGVDDFIVSEELTSLMLAQLAGRFELHQVFDDLFDAEGSSVRLRPVTDYVADPGVSIRELVEAVGAQGASMIGYRRDGSGEVVLNPAKSENPGLDGTDEVVVIA